MAHEGSTIPDFINSEVRLADKVLVPYSPECRRKVHLMEEGGKVSGVDIALDRLTPARAGDPAHLTPAIEGLREAGALHHIPLGLLARGTQHDLDKVFQIAKRSGMKLHLTDAHLAQARLRINDGRCDEARTHLAEAARLITETGYHRRDPELADLRDALEQKGDAPGA